MPKPDTTQLLYETNAMLREMKVDVSYIKQNFENHKRTVEEDIRIVKDEVADMKTFKAKVVMVWGIIVFVLSTVANKVLANF